MTRLQGRAILVIGAITQLAAHDLYVFPERFIVQPRQQLVVAFHNGDAFPASEASPVLERVRDPNLIWAKGIQPLNGLRTDGKRATAGARPPESGEFLLTIRTIPN